MLVMLADWDATDVDHCCPTILMLLGRFAARISEACSHADTGCRAKGKVQMVGLSGCLLT